MLLGAIFLWLQCVLCAVPIAQVRQLAAVQESAPVYSVPGGELEPLLKGFKQYSIILLLTTSDPKFQCSMCSQFDPIFYKYSQEILSQYPELANEVVFARVDATDHLEFLKSLGVKSIPMVWGFPTSLEVYGRALLTELEELSLDYERDPSLDTAARLEQLGMQNVEWASIGNEHYEFSMGEGEAMNEMLSRLAGFISRTINVDVRKGLEKAAAAGSDNHGGWDYTLVIQAFVLVFVTIKIIRKFRSNSEESGVAFWQEKKLYAYLCIVFIYFSISGVNFCMQRHAPFIAQKKGKLIWLAEGTRNQLGWESILSVLFQSLFTVCLLGLIERDYLVNAIGESANMDVIALVLAGLLFTGGFVFNWVYGMKDPSYAYNLF